MKREIEQEIGISGEVENKWDGKTDRTIERNE